MLLDFTCNFRNQMAENCEWSVCSDHLWTASIYDQLDRVKMNSDTTSSVRVLNDLQSVQYSTKPQSIKSRRQAKKKNPQSLPRQERKEKMYNGRNDFIILLMRNNKCSN